MKRPSSNSPTLSASARTILAKRYLLRDRRDRPLENPEGLFLRAASCAARAEKLFPGGLTSSQAEQEFYEVLSNLEFLPNSPTLMNAGTSDAQLSACFVLPVEDSLDGIFRALHLMAAVHQSGGGTGFSFSRLRPRGDYAGENRGRASGPVSFMSIFDQATEVIIQGGRRRGANMGVLRCDHPDIVEFIRAKQKSQRFANFNLSVGITDAFMRAFVHRREYPLINPRTQRECGRLKARFVFSLMARCAWHSGEPGILYLDEINRRHPLVSLGTIEASNPCGELPLLPYESCNLGSVNLVKMVKDGSVNWEKLEKIISLSIRFLDNILEVNHYPSREIRAASLASRKIGLGVMGFADMLIRLGISYNSPAAVRAAERLMKFIRFCSLKASAKLARERGVFPNYACSVYRRRGLQLRNATLNAIAPTGTLSLIAGCSSGIEPLFAPRYSRRMLEGLLVRETLESKSGPHACARCSGIAPGLYSGAQGEQPSQRSFIRTALEIPPAQHLKIQAAFQRHTDNAVSKTINLKAGSTPKDIEKIFTAAYRLKCKGITVYRYGSRKDQVLNLD